MRILENTFLMMNEPVIIFFIEIKFVSIWLPHYNALS